jgi:rhodanese-related sulfurtransferase
MSRTFVLFLLLVAWLLPACNRTSTLAPVEEVVGRQVSVAEGIYTDVSVAELQTMLANKDFTFVNVHIPFEGDIANTDLSIAYNEIEQNLVMLPAEKDAKIVLYCRSDRMSRIAAETLVDLGFTNVLNLDGGMAAWEQAGLSLKK